MPGSVLAAVASTVAADLLGYMLFQVWFSNGITSAVAANLMQWGVHWPQ